MISVDCYNCGSSRKELWAEENGFSLKQCLDCGLLYVDPRPTTEESSRAHILGMHAGAEVVFNRDTFSQNKLKAYPRVLRCLFGRDLDDRRLSWLDIGCGNGELLVALQQRYPNISARGIEPNLRRQAAARERGLDVGYFELEAQPDRYDVISLLNVYSHLPDPPVFFGLCRKLLRPGGEIVVETGDLGCLTREQIFWPYHLPDHLSFASEAIVKGLLVRTGFGIVAVRKYPTFPSDHILTRLAKETLKIIWPGKKSEIARFRDFYRDYRIGRKYINDMYIRAALPPPANPA